MSQGLAPGISDTLTKLRDPEARLQTLTEPLHPAAVRLEPVGPLQLDRQLVVRALHSAGCRSAPDLSGARSEHLRILLEDDSAWSLFGDMLEAIARGEVPADVVLALALGRLTALQKPDVRARGIVAGAILRTLLGRTLAQQFALAPLEATAPFQYALQARQALTPWPTTLRILTDRDPDSVVLSLNNIGAYGHVKRAAMMRAVL